MKQKYIITLVILFTILTSTGIIIKFRSEKDNKTSIQEPTTTNQPTPTPKQFLYESTTYLVPVTGFKNKTLNISTEELKKLQKLYTTESTKLLMVNQLGFDSTVITTVADPEALAKVLNKEVTSIGIMPVDELSFKVKTLEIDNKFIFDKTLDISQYPLKITESKTSLTQVENISNYTSDNLTKIGHTGSMIPARGVHLWTQRNFGNDYTNLFKSTKPLFDTFDYLSSTFEAPVLGNGNFCDSCTVFVGPEKFMEGVEYSGIDLYSMAANHIMDGGVAGIENTMKLLDDLGIKHTGVSAVDNDDAAKPVLVEVNGLKIAYLAFNDTPGRDQWAMENKPGAASISDWIVDSEGNTVSYSPNEERIEYFLQRAKDLNPDLIFVLMHWGGQEYIAPALDYQVKLKDLLLKYGADFILGDHVHWVQEIEFTEDKAIFYGVGNFIFDQMWSTETQQGMTVELNFLGKELVNIRLHPHQLNLYKTGMPELLKPTDPGYNQTLDRIFDVSEF